MTIPRLSLWSRGIWACQRSKSGTLSFWRANYKLFKTYWIRCPGTLTIRTKTLNRGSNLLRIFSLEHKNAPSPWVRKQARRAENQDGWARTSWSNWGTRRNYIGSVYRDMCPRRSTGKLSRCAGMRSGKPRHRWHWAWQGMKRITRRDFVGALGRKERDKLKEISDIPSDIQEGRTGNNRRGGWRNSATSLTLPSLTVRLPTSHISWTHRGGLEEL